MWALSPGSWAKSRRRTLAVTWQAEVPPPAKASSADGGVAVIGITLRIGLSGPDPVVPFRPAGHQFTAKT